jgi:nitrogen fixation protein FixH
MNDSQKKSKIPYFFLAFFLVVLSVNISYIYISQSTWRGISTQNSYQKGLQYNQVLQTAKKQKELGWKMKIQLGTCSKSLSDAAIRSATRSKEIIYSLRFCEADESAIFGSSPQDFEQNSKSLDKPVLILLDLKDKNSRQILDAKVAIEFKRPTQEGADFTQELKFVDGFYWAKINFPLRGQWDFAVIAVKDQNVFQEVKRYVIQ